MHGVFLTRVPDIEELQHAQAEHLPARTLDPGEYRVSPDSYARKGR